MAGPQQVPTVPPAPVPYSISISIADVIKHNPITGEDLPGKVVQLWVADPTGMKVVFVDPDDAIKVSQDLNFHARQAKTGIIVPGDGHQVRRLGALSNPEPEEESNE